MAPTSAKRRKSKLFIWTMLVSVLVFFGGGTWIALTQWWYTEANQYQWAKKEYDDGKYHSAALRFHKLEKAFHSSARVKEYQFLASVSELRQQLYSSQPDLELASDQLRQFLQKPDADKGLQEKFRKDLEEMLHKLVRGLAENAQQQLQEPNLVKARQTRDQAEATLNDAKRFGPKHPENVQLASVIRDVDQAIVLVDKRLKLLGNLAKLKPRPDDIEAGEDDARRSGFSNDPQVKAVLDGLKTRMIEGIVYENRQDPLPKQRVTEDNMHGLLIVPRVDTNRVKAGASNEVVFALVRGILYALDEENGQVRWATRVGIDTATLPVRLPASATSPEIVLVLSSDTNMLTARDALTGQALWHHDLKSPCLGRPVIVDKRAYVPTYDGKVHDIGIISGLLHGWYKLGIPLSVGGTLQEGTNLLYFPAERRYVYVLDVDKKKQNKPCVAMLATGHPSGSIRSEPIIASWDDLPAKDPGILAIRPRYLVLSQTDGLSHMKLRAYRLPVEGLNAAPLEPEVRVRGWTWFSPHDDPEKIVLVTDVGVVGLFGINQPLNQDRPIYPQLKDEFVLNRQAQRLGRAQVVHVEERDFWLLAQGELQHLQLNLDREQGLHLVRRWPGPLKVGSPLHAGQVNDRRDTLFVVTQPLDRPTCLATAVNANTGAIRWQRQLGLLCQRDPLLLGKKILTMDEGGGMLLFDPEQHPHRSDREWQTGGQVLTKPLDATGSVPPLLLTDSGANSAYQIACPGKGTDLIVRRCEPGKKLVEMKFKLPAPLGGTSALVGEILLLPLADGNLWRQPLTDKRRDEGGGPTWRAVHADADARGHVVALGGDDFLISDGSSGLLRLSWPANALWKIKKLPALPIRRIVEAPVVLPPTPANPGPRVCVADAEGTITLLDGDELKPIRRWSLGDTITAGPFVRGQRIGCVVDRRHLVWIDPAQDEVAWKHTTASEGIVGQPQLAGDLIVVADRAGRFLGLDPATGKPRGTGFTVKSSVAPAVAPVAFGADQVFAPLTDGTVLLLTRKQLLAK